MLNNDALAELNKLKQIIEDEKEASEGIVAGTQGRYGFVKLDDGRSIYLSAEEMQRVLPGDRVKVEVINNDKNKLEAKLEKLLQKNFKYFIGVYTIKGNNHFVIPDHPETSRGLFVPPKERKNKEGKNYSQGDYVQCQVIRHPFQDGKSQVKILQLLGKPDEVGIEHKVIALKYRLNNSFDEKVQQQAQAITAKVEQANGDKHREDFTHLPFVTIDAESTLDLDDALYAEEADGSLVLYSAIADPTSFIKPASPIDKEALRRTSSVYFPGQVLPMLPSVLANETLSLNPNQKRPALVCKITISDSGDITDYQFVLAIVQSQAKLSYKIVSAYLDGGDSPGNNAAITKSLDTLQKIAQARRSYRQQHCLLQDDNIDYRFQLNDKLRIEAIQINEVTSAHRLVEEAMLATNICAGTALAKHKIPNALFATHSGFRPQRTHEAQHLLKLERPDYPREDITTFEGFTQLFHTFDQHEDDKQLKITLRRLLTAAEISNEALAHFGLGFPHYALVTSPIRRYQDFHNHRLLKQIITESSPHTFKPLPQKLQDQISNIRSAQRELDQRLLCHFLADQVEQEFDAKIMAVSSQGLAMRLVDNGAESFVQLRNSANLNVKYDSVYLRLTVNDTVYQLEQVIKVKLDKVNLDRYQLQLSLA